MSRELFQSLQTEHPSLAQQQLVLNAAHTAEHSILEQQGQAAKGRELIWDDYYATIKRTPDFQRGLPAVAVPDEYTVVIAALQPGVDEGRNFWRPGLRYWRWERNRAYSIGFTSPSKLKNKDKEYNWLYTNVPLIENNIHTQELRGNFTDEDIETVWELILRKAGLQADGFIPDLKGDYASLTMLPSAPGLRPRAKVLQ